MRKIFYYALVLLIGLCCKHPLDASEASSDLLSKIAQDQPAEERNALVEQLSLLSTNDLKTIAELLTVEQFDNLFKNIVESDITLPRDIAKSLWQTYMLKYLKSSKKEEDPFALKTTEQFFLTHEKYNLSNETLPKYFRPLMERLIKEGLERIPLNDPKVLKEQVHEILHYVKITSEYALSDRTTLAFLTFVVDHLDSLLFLENTEDFQILLHDILPNVSFRDKNQISSLKQKLDKHIVLKDYPLYEELASFLSLMTILTTAGKQPSISVFYDRYNLENLQNFVMSDIPGIQPAVEGSTSFVKALSSAKPTKIIYNLEGYTQDPSGTRDIFLSASGSLYEVGAPITLEAGTWIRNSETPIGGKSDYVVRATPVGYVLYLPPGEIKAIMVHVYGGFGPKDRKENLFKPSEFISDLERYYLSQGIAIVKLSLVDFLENDAGFNYMSRDIHARLHASIHQFFMSLKSDSRAQIFHANLPDNIPIFLYGASFGGRTAVRHAELYPETFDGYISHDGWLSLEMGAKSDNPKIKERGTSPAKSWLDPLGNNTAGLSRVTSIQRPILLLHNFNDNNVKINVSLAFYKAMVDAHKGDSIALLISRLGNLTATDAHNIGHFEPEREDFSLYAKTIADFMLTEPMKQKEGAYETMSAWAAHQYELYANKYFRAASYEDQMVSELYRLFKNRYRTGTPAKQTIHKAVTTPPSIQQEKRQNNDDLETFWQTSGQWTILVTFYCQDASRIKINKEIEYLKTQTLTDEMVANALRRQAPKIFAFQQVPLADVEAFANSKIVQALFRRYLFDDATSLDVKRSLLEDIFLANPALIQERIGFLETQLSNYAKDLKTIKEKLQQRIMEDKNYLQKRLAEIGNIKEFAKKQFGIAYVLEKMDPTASLEIQKASVADLKTLSASFLEKLDPSSVSSDQFGRVFDVLMHVNEKLPDDLAAALWLSYMQALSKQKGTIGRSWGAMPESAVAFYASYDGTETLTDVMSYRQRVFFNKYLPKGVLTLLRSMKPSQASEEKEQNIQNLWTFPVQVVEALTADDLSLEELDEIFDQILLSPTELDQGTLEKIWEIYGEKLPWKNDGPIDQISAKFHQSARKFYRKYRQSIVENATAPKLLRMLDQIVEKEQL